MSGSFSESGSFSSSQAIIAHFDEAAGVLVEGGYQVSDQAWDSITLALQEETIDEISFWGLEPGTKKGNSLLRLKLDWQAHKIVVGEGDRVELPLRQGSIHLVQVQRAAMAFLRAFKARGLEPQILLRYRPEEQHRHEELNKRYGWTTCPDFHQVEQGSGFELQSRYHSAVGIEHWYAD